jgi:hypothetical protein
MADEISTVASFLRDYGTLIAIPAAALVGSIAYRMQKSVDRKSALIELRRSTYSKYLSLLSKHATKKTSENTSELNAVSMELSVIASDEVVKSVGLFHRTIMGKTTIESDSELIETRLANSILAMRNDCFENSSLTLAELLAVTPLVENKK